MNTISKFRQKQRKQSKNLTPKNYDSSQTTQTRGTSATTPLNETAGPFGKGTTAANNDLNEQHNSTSSNIPPLAKCTEEGVDKGLTSNEAKNQCQDGSDGNGQDGADSNNDGEDPTNEQDGEDKPSQDAEPPKGDEGGENQSNNSTKYKGIASSDAKDQKGEEIPSKENPSKQCTENAAGTHSDTKTSNGDGGAPNQSKNSANNEGGGTSSASKDTPSNNGDNTVLNALIDQTLINRAQEATTDQTTQEANIVHLANSTINDSASDHNVQAPTTPTTKKGNSSSSSRRKQFRGVQVKLDAITRYEAKSKHWKACRGQDFVTGERRQFAEDLGIEPKSLAATMSKWKKNEAGMLQTLSVKGATAKTKRMKSSNLLGNPLSIKRARRGRPPKAPTGPLAMKGIVLKKPTYDIIPIEKMQELIGHLNKEEAIAESKAITGDEGHVNGAMKLSLSLDSKDPKSDFHSMISSTTTKNHWLRTAQPKICKMLSKTLPRGFFLEQVDLLGTHAESDQDIQVPHTELFNIHNADDDHQPRQGIMLLSEAEGTILYNMDDAPMHPSSTDIANQLAKIVPPPAGCGDVAQVLDNTSRFSALEWGRLFWATPETRQAPRQMQQFDTLLLTGNHPHCGPGSATKNRFVFFFTARHESHKDIDQRDQQMSREKLMANIILHNKKTLTLPQLDYFTALWIELVEDSAREQSFDGTVLPFLESSEVVTTKEFVVAYRKFSEAALNYYKTNHLEAGVVAQDALVRKTFLDICRGVFRSNLTAHKMVQEDAKKQKEEAKKQKKKKR